MPILANAQADGSISPENSTLSNFSLNITEDVQNEIDNSDPLAEMPILNPQSNAVIKVYHPLKNLVHNMPIIGKQDTSKLHLDFNKSARDLTGDKNKSSKQ